MTDAMAQGIASTRESLHWFLMEKAENLDEEYRRIRDQDSPAKALAPARRAMYIRRLLYSLDDNVSNTSALARSMTYVTRSLKEAAAAGEDLGESLEILKETCQLYRALTSHDDKYRANLASSLYNLSYGRRPRICIGCHCAGGGFLVGIVIGVGRLVHGRVLYRLVACV